MSFADLMATADDAVRDRLGNVTVEYTPEGGAMVPFEDVIFDETYTLTDGEAGVSQQVPAVWLPLAELPDDPTQQGNPTLVIKGLSYRVREAKPDGMGTVLLLLHRTGV